LQLVFTASVSIAMQEDLHLPLEEESNVTRAQLVYVAQIALRQLIGVVMHLHL
jgi:hypothetical protein